MVKTGLLAAAALGLVLGMGAAVGMQDMRGPRLEMGMQPMQGGHGKGMHRKRMRRGPMMRHHGMGKGGRMGRMHGMMGRPGMGHGGSGGASSTAAVDGNASERLFGFIAAEGLPCMNCHSVTAPGFGPAFGTVAARYGAATGAHSVLASHIRNGFGRMPAGLADSQQASVLAQLILDLAPTGEAD